MTTTVQHAPLEKLLDREIKDLIDVQSKEKFPAGESVTYDALISWIEERVNHWLSNQRDALPGTVELTAAQQKRVLDWARKASGGAGAAADDDDETLDEELGLTDEPPTPASASATSQAAQPAVATGKGAVQADPSRNSELAAALKETHDDLAKDIAGVGRTISGELGMIATRAATVEHLGVLREAMMIRIDEVGTIASQAPSTEDLKATAEAITTDIAELKRLAATHAEALEAFKADLRLVHGSCVASEGVLAEQHQKITKILTLVEGRSQTVREGRAFAAPATPSTAETAKRSDNGRKKK